MYDLELHTEDRLEYQFYPIQTIVLNFKIKAPNDAHIALTTAPHESRPMYEVFLGGWGNTKSAIRRDQAEPDVVKVETPGILDPNNFRGFWIRWDNNTISAGVEGDLTPILEHYDPALYPIEYFGICTGWEARGHWLIEVERETSYQLRNQYYPIIRNVLRFKVKVANDAQISLTTTPHDGRPMYEVFFGGWGNTKSVIRRVRSESDVAEAQTPRIVNPNHFRGFWIRWDNNTISAGLEGDDTPILKHYDQTPFPIRYFGIGTICGAIAYWIIEASLSPLEAPVASGYPSPGPAYMRVAGPYRRPGVASFYHPSYLPQDCLLDSTRCHTTSAPLSAPIGFNAPTNSPRWLPASGGNVPPNAVVGGIDCGEEPLYVARAHHEGALIPGKLNRSYGLAYIACGGRENEKHDYEVLCDCSPRWLPVVADGEIPPNALVGGRSEDGDTLYIGRAFQDGSIAVGKVQSSDGICYISFGGNEFPHEQYDILLG